MPWLGFFHKMALSDIFILLDNVPYSKNSYQNRVRIKSAQGEQWLTVPVMTKGRFGQLTNEVPINVNTDWHKSHLAALRTNYQPAPWYDQVLAWLEPMYAGIVTHLAPFNESLIEAIRCQLGISTRLELASELGSEGRGSELLLELVRAVDGDVYLSGPSGRDYLDLAIFEADGIKVRFQQFDHPVYPQLYGDFVLGLSIIDLLMNVGASAAARYLPVLASSRSSVGMQDPAAASR
jgi:hypothetical protein